MQSFTSSKRSERRFDVVVVGARCAGAPIAMLLAGEGHDVLVVDRAPLPSDTVSTHAIARGGIALLRRWGLLDAVVTTGAPEIRRVAFFDGSDMPVVRTVKRGDGVDFLLAPRRQVLDDVLLGAARGAGAVVRTNATVTNVATAPDGRVCGVHVRHHDGREELVRARFVIGADGVHSRVARAVDARVIDERAAEGATHYTYVAGLESEDFEFHLGTRGFAGAFRTHYGESNVWICVPADRALRGPSPRMPAFLETLADIAPALAARVDAGEITAPVRGASGLPNHVRDAAGRGWALCGDAGYHRDPITGHGITDAFRDAHLLAHQIDRVLSGDATEHDAMAEYRADRLEALEPIFDVTTALAAYPPRERFVALQRELSVLFEAEAAWIAALPAVGAHKYAVA